MKYIRQNEQQIRQMLNNRNVKNVNMDDILALDQKRIQLQQQIEQLQQELNIISNASAQNRDIEKAKTIKAQIQEQNINFKTIQDSLKQMIDYIPNIISADVPLGQTCDDNQIIKSWHPSRNTKNVFIQAEYLNGSISDCDVSNILPHTADNHATTINDTSVINDITAINDTTCSVSHSNQSHTQQAFNNPTTAYKLHTEIGGKFFDPAGGVRIAGSRYSILHTELAKLHRALSSWLLSENTKAGYSEIVAPYIMNAEIAYGMGVLPKFQEDLFQLTNGQYLIPTGEASIIGMFLGQSADVSNGPIKLTAYTPCFRAEAGAAGKNTSNMIRLHQFHKVEIIQIVHADQATQAHEDLTLHAESLLEKLELPYKRIILCTGDMGFHSHKTYDLEVFMPGMNKYVEISSCSNTHEFQARRLDMTNKQLPYIINGSALPIERTLAAILENYHQNGKIIIPEVLREYMHATEIVLSA